MSEEFKPLLESRLEPGPSEGFNERVLYKLRLQQRVQKKAKTGDEAMVLILYGLVLLFIGMCCVFGIKTLRDAPQLFFCALALPAAIIFFNRVTDTVAGRNRPFEQKSVS